MPKAQTTSTRKFLSIDGMWRSVVDTQAGAGTWRRRLGAAREPVPASCNDLFPDPGSTG
ncbi:hypothetical protein [Prauserella endophytica]|uniref:hypothetical protein n=1 Tax=Prauserella endophytica TaxID=1592324 RepID=UPI0013052AC5|nr:hypothetical protein [Prauserella endophytica]